MGPTLKSHELWIPWRGSGFLAEKIRSHLVGLSVHTERKKQRAKKKRIEREEAGAAPASFSLFIRYAVTKISAASFIYQFDIGGFLRGIGRYATFRPKLKTRRTVVLCHSHMWRSANPIEDRQGITCGEREIDRGMGLITGGRISGFLPDLEAFSVHYPGYPSSTSRAIETLGGTEGILKVGYSANPFKSHCCLFCLSQNPITCQCLVFE